MRLRKKQEAFISIRKAYQNKSISIPYEVQHDITDLLGYPEIRGQIEYLFHELSYFYENFTS